jgi:hypothetical protein
LYAASTLEEIELMRSRTLLIVVVCAALFVTVILHMRGGGHQMLAKWMPALHGR